MSSLRKSAKGKRCTVRVPGVCRGDTEHTVLAHVKGIGAGEGMGLKGDDRAAVYACDLCHDLLDGRGPNHLEFKANKWWYVARALFESFRIQIEEGLCCKEEQDDASDTELGPGEDRRGEPTTRKGRGLKARGAAPAMARRADRERVLRQQHRELLLQEDLLEY